MRKSSKHTPAPAKQLRDTGWDRIADVESDSEPGVRHEIKRHRTTGRIGCACLAYRFAKADKKICKHIEALGLANVKVAENQQLGALRISVPIVAVKATLRGETFTVTRRAISFGEIKL